MYFNMLTRNDIDIVKVPSITPTISMVVWMSRHRRNLVVDTKFSKLLFTMNNHFIEAVQLLAVIYYK